MSPKPVQQDPGSTSTQSNLVQKHSFTQLSVSSHSYFQLHSSFFFYISCGILVLVMMVCIVCFLRVLYLVKGHAEYEWEISFSFAIFFGCGSALLVYRLFGIKFVTEIIHGVVHLIVVACLIAAIFFTAHEEGVMPDFYDAWLFPTYFLFAVYIVQCCSSFLLVAFLPGNSNINLTNLTLCHSFGGIIIFCIITWNFSLHVSMMCIHRHILSGTNITDDYIWKDHIYEPIIIGCFSAVYSFFILFILLNPNFDYKARNRIRHQIEGRKRLSFGPRTLTQ